MSTVTTSEVCYPASHWFNCNFLPSLQFFGNEGTLNPISSTMVLQKEKEETEHSVLSRMERRRGSRRYLGPRCPESCPQAGCWFNWCVPLNQPRIIAIWLVAFCNPACELFRWKNVVRRRLQTSWTPTCGEEERAAGWLTMLSPNKAAMLMFVPGGPDEEGGSPRSRIGFKDSKRQLTLGGLYAEKMQRLKRNKAKTDSMVWKDENLLELCRLFDVTV